MEQDVQALGEVRLTHPPTHPSIHGLEESSTHPSTPLQTGTQTAVVEAAVMLEAGWEDGMDEVWVVCVEPDVAK